MYVSELITKEERKKWKKGDSIFITTPTGSGKSYFVTEELASDGGNILLISNRKLLRQQNSLAVRTKDNVETINYQGLVNIPNIFEYLKNFDILVLDEIQYVFSDSFYNRTTDQILSLCTNPSKNHINIFITATPEVFETISFKADYRYESKTDYSYIKNIYTYHHNSSIDRIIHSIPEGEKCLCFCVGANTAYELSNRYPNSSFLCSEYNSKFYKFSSKDERASIISEEKFKASNLFTTQVLDNGVNLKDRDLKHIIIDAVDPVTFIQCLGRKRMLDSEDKVDIYIKNQNGKTLNGLSVKLSGNLKLARESWELGEAAFREKYNKIRLPDIIDNDLGVNKAKYYSYKYYQNLYYTMCMDADKKGYLKNICFKLGKKIEDVKVVEEEIAKVQLSDMLEKYIGKPLNKKKQKQFTSKIFSADLISYINTSCGSGLSTLNTMLSSLALPYIVISKRIRTPGKREMVWFVEKIEEEN